MRCRASARQRGASSQTSRPLQVLRRGRARWAVIWALLASSGGTLGPEQPILRKKGSMEIDTLGMDMPRDETTLGASIKNNNSCILPASNTLPRLNLN